MKKSVILLVLLFYVSFVYAQDFSVTDLVIKNTIKPDGVAKFQLSVKNDGRYGVFKISVLSPEWISDLDEYLLSLSNNEVESTEISLRPKKDVNAGNNKVILLVNALNDENRSLQYPLNVMVENYNNIVDVSVSVPDEIDVRTEVPIKLNFENVGLKDFKNIKVNLTSEGLDESFTIDIDYREKVEQDIFIKFDRKTRPGKHTLNIEIFDNEELISKSTREIKIVNSIDVKDKEIFENGFLYSIYKVVRTNDGNSVSKESVVLEIPSFKGIFTGFSPSPTRVKDNVYVWEFELKPSKEYVISVNTDYRPFILELLCLVLFIVMVIVVMKNKVSVRKKIEVLKTEGGGKRFKVSLFVKNNRNYNLKNVKIIDHLPGFLYTSGKDCSVKPEKIVKDVDGTKLEWVIPDFLSKSERIFSYEIYSTLRIVGELQIPKTIVKYRNKRGREVTDKSNFLSALFSRHR